MKYLLSILICLFALSAVAQSTSKKFVEEARKNHQVIDMSFSGGLVKMALGDEPSEELLDLADRVTEITWFVTENGSAALFEDLNRYEQRIMGDGFEALATIRHEGANVQVLIQETGGEIREIVAFARDGSDVFFASVTGNFNLKDIENMKIISEEWDK